MTNWLCWHVGTVNDPKLAAVAKRCGNVSWHLVVVFWAYLLETAAEADPRGSIEALDIESASIALQASEEELVSILKAIEAKEMISGCSIVNWAKRQHGKSTERVRAFRERKKQDEALRNVSETERNAHETCETTQDSTVQDIQNKTEKRDIASLVSSTAQNNKMPSGKPTFSTAQERKARWQQNMMDEIRRTQTPERAEKIIAAYLEGQKWAVDEFEKVDKRVKSLRGARVA